VLNRVGRFSLMFYNEMECMNAVRVTGRSLPVIEKVTASAG
jgi:hypothetical protein